MFLPVFGKHELPWKKSFENFFVAPGASEFEAGRKKALLLHCLGAVGQQVYYALPDDAELFPPADNVVVVLVVDFISGTP